MAERGKRCALVPLIGVLVLALALAGCGPGGRAAQAERDRQGAIAALVGYLDHRQQNDLPGAYDFLSREARELYTRESFVKYYEPFAVMHWQKVGPVILVKPDWARIVVYDITAANKDGTSSPLPDFPYYLHKSGGKWGVAVVNPVMGSLSKTASAADLADKAKPLLKVNPYSTNVHSELFLAYTTSGDQKRADEELRTLYSIISPSDLARFQAFKAQSLLGSGKYNQAIASLGTALDLSKKYPEAYSDSWRSWVLTVKAEAEVQAGDLVAARRSLTLALMADPQSEVARQLQASLDSGATAH